MKPIIYNFLDLDAATRTLWGEARGEDPEGQLAVAWVFRNRLWFPHSWGDTIQQVCQKPFQFSCWNKSDPNLEGMLDLRSYSDEYKRLEGIVKEALDGKFIDPSMGSTFYFAPQYDSVDNITNIPEWAKYKTYTYYHKKHIFYRLTPGGEPFNLGENHYVQ